jgi:hypothetical protein
VKPAIRLAEPIPSVLERREIKTQYRAIARALQIKTYLKAKFDFWRRERSKGKARQGKAGQHFLVED